MSFFHIAIIKNKSQIIAEYTTKNHQLHRFLKILIRDSKEGKTAFKIQEKV